MSIIGHTQVLHFFDRAIANEKIAHAYVFVGPARVGKRTVAEWVARKLIILNGQSSPSALSLEGEGTLNHPDIVHLGRVVDEKTGKLKRDIAIAQVRELIRFMSMASFHGGRKVAIIEQAETLSLEAANGLLKTLEEPTASSVLILIAEHLERLPETVVSRCQVLRFWPVPTAIIAEGLRVRGIEVGLAEEFAADAGGRPGVAVEWIQDLEAREEWVAGRAQFEKLVGASLAERFKFAEKISKSAEAREAVGEMLGRWIEAARARLISSAGGKPSPQAPAYRTGRLSLEGEGANSAKISVGAIDRIREARVMLRENVGVKLVMEWALMSL